MSITYKNMGYCVDLGYQSADFWYLHMGALLESQGEMRLIANMEWYGKRETQRWQGADFHMEDGFQWMGASWKPSNMYSFISITNIQTFSNIVTKIMDAVYYDSYGYSRDKSTYYSFYNVDPRMVISALEKRGVRRYYYDTRVARYILLDEMPPIYMPSWKATGIGYEVIAEDEREARNKLTIEMPQAPSVMRTHLNRWFEDGRPVEENNRPLNTEPSDSRYVEWYVGELLLQEARAT